MIINRVFPLLFWLCSVLSVQGQNLSDGFTSQAIPDSIWNLMQGKTYQPNDVIHRSDLRYLQVLHWDYDQQTHRGELICNKLIADKLITIFKELYRQHYPIEKIKLPDNYGADDEKQMADNNTSCFCFRNVPDTKKLSYHARGLALISIHAIIPMCAMLMARWLYNLKMESNMPIAIRTFLIRLQKEISVIAYLSSMVLYGAAHGRH